MGLVFFFFFLKETKNKTLEEVQELFMSKKYKAKLERDRQRELKEKDANDTRF